MKINFFSIIIWLFDFSLRHSRYLIISLQIIVWALSLYNTIFFFIWWFILLFHNLLLILNSKVQPSMVCNICFIGSGVSFPRAYRIWNPRRLYIAIYHHRQPRIQWLEFWWQWCAPLHEAAPATDNTSEFKVWQ
jgi:hypothetical protein